MTCKCRKGATCAEHLAETDLSLSPKPARRPWWWLLAAPFYVAAGLWEFLTGKWWKS